ncbi:hypothetical protein G7062_08165 [Erysipelothrix sp. HDW6C]|uniref:type II restriction enzyme n=1 Tax=Erysipelothrix sp. HDW6C TaxID=2714930 RepID=UPI00140A117F|nr:hypothetical protein [Erysipelothrix sp. HDW6C]QIK70265.1 hypothetical protein G7062_08165 [Erysipelothrix sp. HDW6C]
MARESVAKAWKKIIQGEGILETVKKDGIFEITADTIKKYGREPRLMTKFDFSNQRPEIFIDNDLCILSIDNGVYTIGSFQAYHKFPSIEHTEILYRELPIKLETLNVDDVYSESAALHVLEISGILDEFLDEEYFQTISGRMRAEPFDFQINSKDDSSFKYKISILRPQMEIDGGYESETSVLVVEAKNRKSSDFIVRQLYYPYRHWKNRVSKEVLPIYVVYDNGIYNLYQYRFEDDNQYNSLRLTKTARYIIKNKESENYKTTILKKAIPVTPSDVPFPQANSFNTIISIILGVEEFTNAIKIAEFLEYDIRQGQYYLKALVFLGVLEKKERAQYTFTDLGRKLRSSQGTDFKKILVSKVLNLNVFNQAYEYLHEFEKLPTEAFVIDLLRIYQPKLGGSTPKRRYSTVIAWITWLDGVVV